MKRLLAHGRDNAVAYLALSLALGGTSYAALSLPAASVGSRQLKNHSITPIKLSRQVGAFGGYVRDWALIDKGGRQLAGNRPAVNEGGQAGPVYGITWRIGKGRFDAFSSHCVPVVTVQAAPQPNLVTPAPAASATARNTGNGFVLVYTYNAAGQPQNEPFYIQVVC
jgi:hypothetical protein